MDLDCALFVDLFCLFVCTSLCVLFIVTPPSTPQIPSVRERVGEVAAAASEAAVAQFYEHPSAETSGAIRVATRAATAAAAEAFSAAPLHLEEGFGVGNV